LLTIVTRCYNRPLAFKRCLRSIERQTSENFEHVLIIDEIGRGIRWANKQIAEVGSETSGHYIYILDDDDFLLNENFVSDFTSLINKKLITPQLVIVKGWILEKEVPVRWERPPKRGQIGAPNFIVRRDLFKKFSKYWGVSRAGDWNFIRNVMNVIPVDDFFWWDKFVFYADPSVGKSEKLKNELRNEIEMKHLERQKK